eukprot:1157262-Pelagomonas_calceolata.AAC.1
MHVWWHCAQHYFIRLVGLCPVLRCHTHKCCTLQHPDHHRQRARPNLLAFPRYEQKHRTTHREQGRGHYQKVRMVRKEESTPAKRLNELRQNSLTSKLARGTGGNRKPTHAVSSAD